ncbi:MAG TPA: glycosyltransferase 87 family protein [Streptosporangiaceae bacterium]|nr:glycosyltransferase 87 family protein [Streptosporangiaceae bacterium]
MSRARALALFIAAAAAFSASIVVYRLVYVTNPGLWSHTDEWVYWAAGRVVRRDPANLYVVRLGEPLAFKLPFTYPPFAAWLFSFLSGFTFRAWEIALVVLDLTLMPAITYLSLRIAGHRGSRNIWIALALAAIALWLEPVFSTMFFGQINLILLTLILVDFALPDSCRWKGICTGIAAGIKLTPLIFIPYLFVTRRIRAGVVSLLTFGATVGLGFLTMPTAARDYWAGLPSGPGGASKMVNQSLNGVIQRFLHGQAPASTVWAVTALVVATAGVALAGIAGRRGLELLGVLLCGITGLLVSPISWTHHWVWVVPALVLVTTGMRPSPDRGLATVRPVRRRTHLATIAAKVLGTAALLGLFVEWPGSRPFGRHDTLLPHGLLRLVPWSGDQVYTWRGATWLLGNAYVLAGLAALIGAGVYLWLSGRHARRTARLAPVSPARRETREPPVPVGAGSRR